MHVISIVFLLRIPVMPLALKSDAHRWQVAVWASTWCHCPHALIFLAELWYEPCERYTV